MLSYPYSKHNVKLSIVADVFQFAGNGIINADGQLWKIQRKAGLRFFSAANLKFFVDDLLPPILADTRKSFDDASLGTCLVDLQDVFLELTTRLMGKVAYDVRTPLLKITRDVTDLRADGRERLVAFLKGLRLRFWSHW